MPGSTTYQRQIEKLVHRKGDVETVLVMSSLLEKTLKERWRAEGRGLGQMARNLQGQLGRGLEDDLRRFAGLRNKAAHEAESFRLYNRQQTIHLAATIYARLQEAPQKSWWAALRYLGVALFGH